MKNRTKPYIIFRIPRSIHVQMLEDLHRAHEHASERVGFIFTKSKVLEGNKIVVVATAYEPVDDEDYIEDNSVSAKIGSNAIRKAMQYMFEHKTGCMHVHLHDFIGKPTPSGTDLKSLPGVVESLSNIAKGQVTGFLILSKDGFYSAMKTSEDRKLTSADEIVVVGFPMEFHYKKGNIGPASKVFDRQSFLGTKSELLFQNVRIGIIGYGGGGSHIGQQLAHIGVKHLYVFDGDNIEESNLNRLVGGQWKDVIKKIEKTEIAQRVIKAILPSARITVINSRWQDAPEKLHECDLVVGCVDTYAERQQLEAESRRYLIPYIDIGMDIHQGEGELPEMSGQVMLSLPDAPCLWCFGFLTEEKLGIEAARYGDVGGRPQVVWPNGVLASTAVGILVELITGWTGRKNAGVYLEYNGNTGIIKDHIRLRFCSDACIHYPLKFGGPVEFKTL